MGMTCSIEGCPKPVYARRPSKGWCVTHYRRWMSHGDPLTILTDRGKPLIERFMKRVEIQPDGCWMWTGATTRGYGQFSVAHTAGRRVAHRWSYEYHVGPIPEGLTIDHLCRNPSCVNPEHLEAVTIHENLMRGDTPAARNAAKTTCPRGHPHERQSEQGLRRYCRQCRADQQRRRAGE